MYSQGVQRKEKKKILKEKERNNTPTTAAQRRLLPLKQQMAELKNIYPPFVNPYKQTGRPLNYTPEELAAEFEKFVAWCEEHPIVIKRTAKGKNSSPAGPSSFDRADIEEKPRLVSVGGFLVWLGQTDSWWTNLDKGTFGDEFLRVKARVRVYCEEYQKNMASAGLFKENIISRLLGLADKQDVQADMQANVEYKFKFGE